MFKLSVYIRRLITFDWVAVLCPVILNRSSLDGWAMFLKANVGYVRAVLFKWFVYIRRLITFDWVAVLCPVILNRSSLDGWAILLKTNVGYVRAVLFKWFVYTRRLKTNVGYVKDGAVFANTGFFTAG